MVKKVGLLFLAVSCAVLVFAGLAWFRASHKEYQKSLHENPSIYTSQTLKEAGVKEGDLLEIKDHGRTHLYYVHQSIEDGGDPHDRVILESPGRFYSPSDGMLNWWRIRERVMVIYHRSDPGYNDKAAEYINQPH